jgi:hypothetical protein
MKAKKSFELGDYIIEIYHENNDKLEIIVFNKLNEIIKKMVILNSDENDKTNNNNKKNENRDDFDDFIGYFIAKNNLN